MKKKILFLISTLNGGGAEKVLVDILHNLDRQKYDITVCTLFDEGVYIRQLPEDVTYRSLNLSRFYAVFWRVLKFLPRKWSYKLWIREKYDVEIAFLEGLSTLLLCGSDCPRKIAWVHTDLVENDYISRYHRSEKHLAETYRQYHKVVFVSSRAQSQFEQRFGTMGTETVIYNLIDKNAVCRRSEEFVPSENPSVPVICTVGRLIPVKGFLRLLSAHKRLVEEGVAHKLWFLGTGEEEEKMKDFVRENGLESSVTFWGFQSNPYPFMARTDIYVCSSFAEGYPLSVAEALVLKKPIVATDCTGPTEILQNGQFGLLTENSEEGIYQGLRLLLTDPQRLSQVHRQAEIGAKHIDPARVIQQIEALF